MTVKADGRGSTVGYGLRAELHRVNTVWRRSCDYAVKARVRPGLIPDLHAHAATAGGAERREALIGLVDGDQAASAGMIVAVLRAIRAVRAPRHRGRHRPGLHPQPIRWAGGRR